MAANTRDAATYSRASEFSRGIGDGIKAKVLGKDMLIHDYEVEQRDYDGEPSTCVIVELSTVSDPANTQIFHAWSESLGVKIADLPKEKLPLLIKFFEADTKRGMKVLTFE